MKIELSVGERLMLLMILGGAKLGSATQLRAVQSLRKRLIFNIAERTKLGMDSEDDNAAVPDLDQSEEKLGLVAFEFNRFERKFLGKYLTMVIKVMDKTETLTEVHLGLGEKIIPDYEQLMEE